MAALTMLGAAAGALALGQIAAQTAMADAARALIASVDAPQRAQLVFPFDADERFNWHFIPRERKGLPLKSMNERQRGLAFALLKAGLSEKGVTKAETIRGLEDVLRAMGDRIVRDPELYYFSIFGTPGDAAWGWRYEGHHLSQNWTIVNGKSIATSPAFFGANPAEVLDGPQKGTRALAAEADLAWALLDALTETQRRDAVIAPAAPNDIITGATRTAAIEGNAGLAMGALSASQRGLLMRLIEEHAGSQAPALAAMRLARIRDAGIDHIRFAWMGSTTRGPGLGHYYRLQGPTFLVEYDNVQNRANHQHVVWRDFSGDFGDDLLKRHYEQDPDHRGR
jgi:hypothetical protein